MGEKKYFWVTNWSFDGNNKAKFTLFSRNDARDSW